MSRDVLSSSELFGKIIARWGARPDPSESLTFKQIANLVIGSGTSENASIIGRTIVDFRDYFYRPDRSPYLWSVRWKQIEKDHPSLFPEVQGTACTISNGGPIEDMLQALRDEEQAVKKQARENPIRARVSRGLGQMPDGGVWYEACLDLPGDQELPVPEGVQIRLRWIRALNVYPCTAKLLSYSPLNWTIIFEVEKSLTDSQIKNVFRVEPAIEQLVQAVHEQLSRVSQKKDRLIWGLLTGLQSRNRVPWAGTIIRDRLDETQAQAVESCLNHDITFLWGPPGTGKTHTLGRLMASAALSGKRVIAAAISNIAVDQMAVQVVETLEAAGEEGRRLLQQGRIFRFGHSRDPQVTGEPRLFPNKIRVQELRRELHNLQQQLRELSEHDAEARAKVQHEIFGTRTQLRTLTKLLIDEARIVLTTAVQTCIEPAIRDSSFDLAVIDEASMMPIPYVAVVGALGLERVVITGDYRQLGPIALAQTAAAHRWLHKDPFALAGISGDSPNHSALAMLRVQRRMDEKICGLINQTFYGGKLRTDVTSRSVTTLEPIPGEPAVLVSFLPEDGSLVEQTIQGSRVNKGSAELVVDLACYYLQVDDDFLVGIVAPYRGQVTRIRRLLRERSLSKDQVRRLRLGTVHAFQGSQAAVIIWDLVENRNHKIGRLYHKEAGDRLTNVAISRAQGKLILVGDPDAFHLAPGNESVGKIRAILAQHFHSKSPLVINAEFVGDRPRANAAARA